MWMLCQRWKVAKAVTDREGFIRPILAPLISHCPARLGDCFSLDSYVGGADLQTGGIARCRDSEGFETRPHRTPTAW